MRVLLRIFFGLIALCTLPGMVLAYSLVLVTGKGEGNALNAMLVGEALLLALLVLSVLFIFNKVRVLFPAVFIGLVILFWTYGVEWLMPPVN